MKSKKCTRCKRIKSMSSFNLYKESPNGHNSICRLCQKELRRIYYLNHLSLERKRAISWNRKHEIRYRKSLKKWRKNNPFSMFWMSFKGRAKRYYINFNLSKEDFIKWYNKQEKKCSYCGLTSKQLSKSKDKIIKGYNYLTIDRLDNKKGYVLNNMILACMRCNCIKSDFFNFKEMKGLGKIVRKKALKLLNLKKM